MAQIEKEVTRVDKNGEDFTKNISCILRFIHRARFMTISLSNLVNNLSEGIHKIKCTFGLDGKKHKICKTSIEVSSCFLECISFEDDLIEYKCLYVVTKIINKSLMKSQRNYF